MTPELHRSLEDALGAAPRTSRRVGGGDINDAYAVVLTDDREVFLKTHPDPPPGFFGKEARGLAWLAEAEALRTPKIIAIQDGDDGACAFLALEMIKSSRPAANHDESLGRGLAALHRFGAPSFGLDYENYIGKLPQTNQTHTNWADFYAHERLAPQLQMAVRKGLSSHRLARGIEALIKRLPDLVGPPEPPARLHGDLWGGNAMQDEGGLPCIIDPAVYGGHREVDLAMMRLFGGFSARCFDAYKEAHPLADGAEERVQLYQLYYLLVHLNLFGSGYMGGVLRALENYL